MTKQKYCRCGCWLCGCFSYKTLSEETEKEDVTITLIDRHSYHTMMTELHEVAGGRGTRGDPVRFTTIICKTKNVDLVTDTVIGIDKEKKSSKPN